MNSPETDEELSAIQRRIDRGCPFGDNSCFPETANDLDVESRLDPAVDPPVRKLMSDIDSIRGRLHDMSMLTPISGNDTPG